MFVRTERLLLRPGWPEDAAELAGAIGQRSVVAMLAQAPWPYALADAEAYLALPSPAHDPRFTIIARDAPRPRLIGGIGIGAFAGEPHELGYWLTPDAWGCGYATEAGRAVLDLARESLRLKRLTAGHFTDNPASGAVLRKLGFQPLGRTEPRYSRGRDAAVPCVLMALAL